RRQRAPHAERRPVARAQPGRRARAGRLRPAARRRRLPGARLPREDGAPPRRRSRARRGLHLGGPGRRPPRRVAHGRVLGDGPALALHHPRLVALPAQALGGRRRLRPALRRELRGLGLLAGRGEARLDGPLRPRGARPLPAEPGQPRARLAGARGQHAAHAEPRGQAPRDLGGKHRGCAGGHVRAPGGRGADARAHLRSPRDAGLRPPAEPARPAAGGLRFMPEVSIVIRCRDEARHLGPVLEAVLGQEGAPAAEVEALTTSRNFPPAPPPGVLFSTANGAVRRAAVLARPFDEEIAIAEDHLWARGAVERIAYVPEAAVAHSHAMSLAVWRARFYAHGLAAEYARRRRGIELPWGEPRDGAARAFARLVGTLARRGEVRALAHLPSHALP